MSDWAAKFADTLNADAEALAGEHAWQMHVYKCVAASIPRIRPVFIQAAQDAVRQFNEKLQQDPRRKTVDESHTTGPIDPAAQFYKPFYPTGRLTIQMLQESHVACGQLAVRRSAEGKEETSTTTLPLTFDGGNIYFIHEGRNLVLHDAVRELLTPLFALYRAT